MGEPAKTGNWRKMVLSLPASVPVGAFVGAKHSALRNTFDRLNEQFQASDGKDVVKSLFLVPEEEGSKTPKREVVFIARNRAFQAGISRLCARLSKLEHDFHPMNPERLIPRSE